MSDTRHVVPVNDLIEHDTTGQAQCVCGPEVSAVFRAGRRPEPGSAPVSRSDDAYLPPEAHKQAREAAERNAARLAEEAAVAREHAYTFYNGGEKASPITTRVVAAFPATGKTHLASTMPGVVDSDSSSWSWAAPGERHPDWPANYIAHVRELIAEPSIRLILVSAHDEVRRSLTEAGIDYTVVYPHVSLREEYRQRMLDRGSPAGLIAKVIDDVWGGAIASCARQPGARHLCLWAGEHLSDVVAAREAPDA